MNLTGPNLSQLKSIALLSGAYCGGCLGGTLANFAKLSGAYICAALVVGVIAGGFVGWVSGHYFVPLAQALLSIGRPQTLATSSISTFAVSLTAISAVAIIGSVNSFTILAAIITSVTIVLVFGVSGKAP